MENGMEWSMFFHYIFPISAVNSVLERSYFFFFFSCQRNQWKWFTFSNIQPEHATEDLWNLVDTRSAIVHSFFFFVHFQEVTYILIFKISVKRHFHLLFFLFFFSLYVIKCLIATVHRCSVGFSNVSVVFKCPSRSWQRDTEPEHKQTILGRWRWSS